MPNYPRLTRGVQQNAMPDTYLYKTLSSDINNLQQDNIALRARVTNLEGN